MNCILIARSLAAFCLLSLSLAVSTLGAEEPVAVYSTGDWTVKGLGNVRARVTVGEKAEAVWAHIPWRRRDALPENKRILVVDGATGTTVTNALTVRVSRESGDLLFEPVSGPGEYFVYYLPFQTAGEWYFPSTRYLVPTNTAAAGWAAAHSPAGERIRRGQPAGVPAAHLIDLQSINDFHRFDPMEITATTDETSAFMAAHRNEALLLFPEDRTHPIRLNDELPLRWIQLGPARPFAGQARPGEFYAFQIGLFANKQGLDDVWIACDDLTGSAGAVIPGSAVRCFNLAGTNWLGQPIHKAVAVPRGKIQALWLGVTLPAGLPAQTFRGKVRVGARAVAETSVPVELQVSSDVLSDAGDSELWRQSRLRWLDSTIGLDDEVFAPYSPVVRRERTLSILGRSVTFNATGLLDEIFTTFTRNVDGTNGPARQVLAGPMTFVAEMAGGPLTWTGTAPRIVRESGGAVAWQADSSAGPLQLDCVAKLECDGYVNFKLSVRGNAACEVNDLRLEIPLRRDAAVYMMGMGCKGGYRPPAWDWKWDVDRANNQLWIGDVNAGLSCKLKDIEDRWDLANLKESGTYRDWSNQGQGGCKVREDGDRVVIRAYTGPRKIARDEVLHFNFGLLITPVKTLDNAHWGWRYFHQGSAKPVAEVAKTGATLINLHQGDALNPYINYPFLTVDKLSAYAREAHERGMKVKLYYTIRELSDYTAEFWALRSLGKEVFSDGPGFRLADQFATNQPGQSLPKTGDSWLCEHVVDGYTPAWHQPLGNGHVDAAIATAGLSRWHNYYLEGLSWLIRNVGIDGLYLDGIGYDREIMKRVRKVMQRQGKDCLIDFHSGNNYHPEYGLNNCANEYLELFPFIDSLWFGEGFDYNEPPDYWLVEIAGLPYGLFGEMLQNGGNPWRGMLFGMTGRLGWGGNPQTMWKEWDEFGIQKARMSGFWDPACPVKTGRKETLATAYVREGKTLVAVATWATNTARVRPQVDWQQLGLNPARVSWYAPPIPGFQAEAKFRLDEEIPVHPGSGWLFLLDEVDHRLSRIPDMEEGRKVLLDERFEHTLEAAWKTEVSPRPQTRIQVSDGKLVITAAANTSAFATRDLPSGVELVTCAIEPRTDEGASWGPGLALLWPDGKALRVYVRHEGRFGSDDGKSEELGGAYEPGKPCRVGFWFAEKDIVAWAAPEGEAVQEIFRFPRQDFPGEPSRVRIGKMRPGSILADYSVPGPEGACAITALRAFGHR